MKDKVTRQCPQTTTLEEKGEPKRTGTEDPLLTSLTNALLLGQTGSLSYATEGALFISKQLSSDAVSALRKVGVLI